MRYGQTRADDRLFENDPRFTLDEAVIGPNRGGFFSGDVGGAHHLTGGKDYTYQGKWGGQFYGDTANHVGGTFGALGKSDALDDDDEIVFVGAFRANNSNQQP